MLAPDFTTIKAYIVEPQVLICNALRVLIDQFSSAQVVGDATSLNLLDLKRTSPDLLIYGLDNAAGDLGETVAAIHAQMPNLRVCVLSSYPNPEVMQRCMTLGIDGFLLKDMSIGELDVAIRVIAKGSCYVDPRVAGRMMRRSEFTGIVNDLNSREAEIVRLIALGYANKEIGVRIQLSEKTIKNYISRIFVKLNVTARTQAAVYAIKSGMV